MIKLLIRNISESKFQTSLSLNEIEAVLTEEFHLRERYAWLDGLNTKQQGVYKNQRFRIEGVVAPFASIGKNPLEQLFSNYILTEGAVSELQTCREVSVQSKLSFSGKMSFILIVIVTLILLTDSLVMGNYLSFILGLLVFSGLFFLFKRSVRQTAIQRNKTIEALLEKT